MPAIARCKERVCGESMQKLASIIVLLLNIGIRWLDKLDKDRADAFRADVSTDPSGVLVQQLSGKGSASDTHSAEHLQSEATRG